MNHELQLSLEALMVHTAISPGELARQALDLLDSHDEVGARELLERFADAHEPKPGTAPTEFGPEDFAAFQLAQTAFTCMVGPSWFTVLGYLEGHADTEPHRSKYLHGIPDVAARMPVEADRLAALRAHLIGNPIELERASACFRDFSNLSWSLPAQSTRRSSRLRKGLSRDLDFSKVPAPRITVNYDELVRGLLQLHRAELAIGERAMRRLVWTASKRGMPQREIAGLIERPQTQVFRDLKAVDEDPTLLALSPREINDNFKAGRFDRVTLLKLLSAFPYTRGEFPVDEPEWGYLPGSWDELSQLTIEGEITREELDLIVDASRAKSASHG